MISHLRSLLVRINQFNFNKNLRHAENSHYACDFSLSLQSFSLILTIDKQTRVYNYSAALSDNILTNKVDVKTTSGNIISDTSDRYSQFCVFHTSHENSKSRVTPEGVRDVSEILSVPKNKAYVSNLDRFVFYPG